MLFDVGERFKNNVLMCLDSNKLVKLELLFVILEMVMFYKKRLENRMKVIFGIYYGKKELL